MTDAVKYICFALISLTITSCSRPQSGREVIRHIHALDSLAELKPDSALSIIDRIDIESLQETDRTDVHYAKGCAKLRLNNFPDATQSFLRAEKSAEITGNDSLLLLSRLRMADLSDSIHDDKSKTYYLIRACEVYAHTKDYDNLYTTLSEMTIFSMTRHPEYIDEINRLANLLKDNDTVPSYTKDSISRGELILRHTGEAYQLGYITYFLDNRRLHPFSPSIFIENILEDREWEKTITNDSTIIEPHDAILIAEVLWRKNQDRKAHEFIRLYTDKYREKEPIHSPNPTTGCLELCSIGTPDLPPLKTRLYSMFQNDVRTATMQFHYREQLNYEQTIHRQQTVLILMTVTILLILSAIILYLRVTAIRRQHREEEYMRTASELHTALAEMEGKHLNTLNHLCNTYYENYSHESAKSKAAREAQRAIEEIAGDPDLYTRLEARLDASADDVMRHLHEAFPNIKEIDSRMYTLNAIGLTIPAICMLLKERREVI